MKMKVVFLGSKYRVLYFYTTVQFQFNGNIWMLFSYNKIKSSKLMSVYGSYVYNAHYKYLINIHSYFIKIILLFKLNLYYDYIVFNM